MTTPPVQPATANQPRGPIALAILSLVIGIAGFVFALIPWLGIALGAIAIVLGVISLLKRWARGLSIAGIVIGGIAIVFALTVVLLLVVTQQMIESQLG